MHTYHAHVYFSANEIALATQVRENIAHALPQLTYIGKLIPFPIGPHSKPMFEMHIPASEIDSVRSKLDELRQGLSVLIHPVQANELDAHTVSAQWLGTKLALDLSVF